MLLTAIGTYGVLSYAVSQRQREIGVRMALGARPGQIRSQFLMLALRLLAAGTVFGHMGAWLTGRGHADAALPGAAVPLATFAGAAGVVAVVSLVACLVPSHRASRISPMEALSDQ